MPSQEYSTVLAEKNVVSMLLYLLDGKAKESQLEVIVKNYDSYVSVAQKLVDAGLARCFIGKERRTTKWYELTDKGQKVANYIKAANDVLHGEEPETQDDFVSTPSQIRDRVT
jgi:DNA-binding PadR family transcriptional regulator